MWSVYILLQRVKAQHERYQASSILPLRSSPLFSSPSSFFLSAFHREKDRICLVLLSINHGVNKKASRPVCSGWLMYVKLCRFRTTAKTTGPQCSSYDIIILIWKDCTFVFLTHCSKAALITVEFGKDQWWWLDVAGASSVLCGKPSSSWYKRGATLYRLRKELVFCTENQQSANWSCNRASIFNTV